VTNQAERVLTLYRQLLESLEHTKRRQLCRDADAKTRDADVKVALQNTPAAFHGRPDLAQQLTSELTDVLHSGQILETD
jgi:hypothetical protein